MERKGDLFRDCHINQNTCNWLIEKNEPMEMFWGWKGIANKGIGFVFSCWISLLKFIFNT